MKTSVSLGAYGRTGIKDLTDYVQIAERLGVHRVSERKSIG